MALMSVFEYEKFVEDTWLGRENATDKGLSDLFIMTSGLGGETGEVLEYLKKFVRDGTVDHVKLVKELGDVLYYLTTIGRSFGFSLEDIMQVNIDKLSKRMKNGTMRGSGDDR